MKKILILISILALLCACSQNCKSECAVLDVISSAIGSTENVSVKLIKGLSDSYNIEAKDGKLNIQATSPTAACYAFSKYLRQACSSSITWSGKHIGFDGVFPDWQDSGNSPYQHRYFLNVCTFGYTTPYWDWQRWSQEIDWMALHGVNMPLASVASEAIARRVWLKLGLSEEQIAEFFTGAAHLPWHRMGNLCNFDGPLPEQWHEDQIGLQHKILDKMRVLGMEPVAPAFAGFIPPAFLDLHPEMEARQLTWGGFKLEENACVLSPDSPYFIKIGEMFVQEWEAEFGKAKYWLSDSFNEMRLPVEDAQTKHALLAEYGETIYKSITAADPEAVWVTQGWTFGYQHDFWDKESLQALLSRVPDDGIIIIDLGNDYPKWVWHTEQTWKTHEGFYGKQWIYSYVPNFGGKVLPTGDLAMYASGSAEALASDYSSSLVGFGSAPEGLENNEIVYELLADMGWTDKAIDLDKWIEQYCLSRYGYFDERIKEAYELLRGSVWSSLYSYPRFLWQTVKPDQRRKSLHDINDDFADALKLLLDCSEQCSNSQLYRNDIVEFSALWLSELADRHYRKAYENSDTKELKKTVEILQNVDKLLASHPNYRLETWVDYARCSSEAPATKDCYEANAKRLITTWGGWQEDYAARLWSGLVGDYYIPRLQIFFESGQQAVDEWEEKWIMTPWTSKTSPFEDPISEAKTLIQKYI